MRVLLYHRLNLGDLVCASPGIQWLRQKHPQASLRLMANEFAARVGGELAASNSLIAPDGGMAHVAAGFGKPVVALFGNVDPAAWRPWSPRAKVLQAASRQVVDLPAEAIVDSWEDALASPA